MEILQFVSIIFVAALSAGTKAFQELNIVHNYKTLIPIFSAVISTCNVIIVGNIAIEAVVMDLFGLFFSIIAMTVGAAVGVIASMSLHETMRKRGEDVVVSGKR